MLKRLCSSCLLVLLLLVFLLPAGAEGLTKQDLYNAALGELQLYLSGDDSLSLDKQLALFEELGRFRKSAFFSYYVRVLNDIELGEYEEIPLLLSWMRLDESFCTLLTEEGYCSVDELEYYAMGRQAEAAGDIPTALACYRECVTMLDSMLRIAQFESKGHVPGALPTPHSAATPAPTPTPAPGATPDPAEGFHLSTTASSGQVRLNWSVPFAGASCTIYRRTRNGSWSKLASTNNAYYFDSAVGNSTTYIYYVEATSGARSVRSAEATATTASASAPNTPSLTPSPAPKTWGAWSSWSTMPVSESSTRQVETKTETIYKTEYRYSKWHYYTTEKVWYNAPYVYRNSPIFSSAKEPYWMYYTSDTPLAQKSTWNGYPYYEDYWFNETKVQVPDGSVTYYRYRDLQ